MEIEAILKLLPLKPKQNFKSADGAKLSLPSVGAGFGPERTASNFKCVAAIFLQEDGDVNRNL